MTLALAIGANASIFSLLNGLALRPLPVRNPEQLIEIAAEFRSGMKVPVSYPMFREFARRQVVLAAIIGSVGTPFLAVEANGALSLGPVNAVTGNFYPELGVKPTAGRLLMPADVNLETLTGAPVAVIGYGLWQRRFGGDLKALGSVVRVQGVPFTVVGVAPRGFKGFGVLAEPDVTVPLTAFAAIFRSKLDYLHDGGLLWIWASGRLRRGASLEQARAQLQALWPAIKSDVVPATHAGAQRANFLAMRLRVESLATGEETLLRPRFTGPLYFLLGISLVVLLVACFNLASVMLPRVVGRSHDLAIRMALGATQRQVVQHVVIETVLMAVAAACVGVGLAYWTSAIVARVMLGNMPVAASLNTAPDLRVLGFTVAISGGAGVLSAAAPAWLMTRNDPRALLQHYVQRISPPGRVGRVLIAGQIALAVVILTNAGLIVRSFQQLLVLNPGFITEGVVSANFQIRPESEARPEIGTYYSSLIDTVKSISGVRQAAIAHGAVAMGGAFVQPVSRMSSEPADGIPAAFNSVSPGFFDVLGIRIIQGRDFEWTDRPRGHRVAILERNLANRLFPNQDPIGQVVRIGTQPYRQDLEIVGIAADARLYDLKDPASYAAYVPALQVAEPMIGGFLIIAGDGIDEGRLQRAVRSIGPDYIVRVDPLAKVLGAAVAGDNIAATIAAFFGTLTLVLTALGVGGLVAYTVARRTQEIAIRLALGAQPTRIFVAVLGDGAATVSLGLVVGLSVATISTKTIRGLLFGVGPHDPIVWVGVPVVLSIVAMCACLVPAFRAVATDPNIGLRTER